MPPVPTHDMKTKLGESVHFTEFGKSSQQSKHTRRRFACEGRRDPRKEEKYKKTLKGGTAMAIRDGDREIVIACENMTAQKAHEFGQVGAVPGLKLAVMRSPETVELSGTMKKKRDPSGRRKRQPQRQRYSGSS